MSVVGEAVSGWVVGARPGEELTAGDLVGVDLAAVLLTSVEDYLSVEAEVAGGRDD